MNSDTQEYKDMIKSFKPMADRFRESIDDSLAYYTPIVDNIIQNRIEDKNSIEHTFDGILDIAFDERALVLYKKLARYYYTINEEVTFFYINAYREMWDSED